MSNAVRRQALLSHGFWNVGATAGLVEAWDQEMGEGTDRPIAGLPNGLDRPEPAPRPDRVVVLGARSAETPPGSPALRQMLAYQARDVVGLAVLRAPNDDSVRWSDLTEAAGPPGDDRIGGVSIHLGLANAMAGPTGPHAAAVLARDVHSCLPGGTKGGWERSACGFHDGITVWELPAPFTQRHLVVVAPMAQEDALDRWSWSTGGPMLPPLTLYLLHAARLRYQQSVLQRDLPDLRHLLDEVADSSRSLLGLLGTQGEVPAPAGDLLRQVNRLVEVGNRHSGLVDSLARVRTMTRSVRLADRNLSRALDPPVYAGDGGFLDADRQIDESLTEQLLAEETFLQAELERGGPLLNAAHRALDERLHDRWEERNLLQTSVIGALLAILAAIQSLQYTIAVPGSLHAPLIAVVGAVVLWLPSAVLHGLRSGVPRRAGGRWHHLDRVFLALAGSALGWLLAAAIFRYGWGHSAPVWVSLAGAAAVAVVASVTALVVEQR